MAGGWLFWALASALFAALTAIFAKVGVQQVDPDLATLVRTAVILVLVALIVLVGGRWRQVARLETRTVLLLVLSALTTGASWLCYFRALRLGPVSRVAPIDKLSVVLVAILATVLLGERPSLRDWGAIGLISAGAVLLAWR